MYCKHCGKQISDDSSFCQYCGGKVIDESISKDNDANLAAKSEQSEDNISEVVITTKETKPIQVEVSKKSNNNSSTIANEIVGNLKMIGLAAALFAVYIIGFILVHQKDITKYDYNTQTSYYGESCYDQLFISGNWKFHWEQHYYESLYYRLHNQVPFYVEIPTPEQCMKFAEELEKEIENKKAAIAKRHARQNMQNEIVTMKDLDDLLIEQTNIEELKAEAKKSAERDIQDWNDTINNNRQWGYENDLKKNALYAALICLALTLLGRYILKLFNWVSTNKTS